MGVSTDAILVYGFEVKEGSETHTKLEELDWTDEDRLEKAIGIEVVRHCSDEFLMYIVGVAESQTKANRGYPKGVTGLEAKEGWEDKLRAFCEEVKIPCEPCGWLLCSYWG